MADVPESVWPHSSIEVNVKLHPREWKTRPVLLARFGQVFWKANVIERHCNLHYYIDCVGWSEVLDNVFALYNGQICSIALI